MELFTCPRIPPETGSGVAAYKFPARLRKPAAMPHVKGCNGPVILYAGLARWLATSPGQRAEAGHLPWASGFLFQDLPGELPTAEAILQAAGITDDKRDPGFIALSKSKDAAAFVEQCRALRFWEREAALP